MRIKPWRAFSTGSILECITWRGREAVTVLDAQCRDQNWAYLVITADGRLMVTWPVKASTLLGIVNAALRQIDRVPPERNPNVSIMGRCFASKLYIPY